MDKLTGIHAVKEALEAGRPLEYVLVAVFAWLAGLVWIGETGSMQMTIVQGTTIFDVILVVVLGGISLIGGRGGVFSVVVGCALIGTLLLFPGLMLFLFVVWALNKAVGDEGPKGVTA